ncbi:MAG: tetratricopeptide repeat protein [Magnetococcales bacterium]|nr:tetratricopeptide repeat protein [Magnetococcales bacterium]
MNIQHIRALKKGLDHLLADRPDKTLAIAARVLEQDPGNGEGWFLSGVACQRMGRHRQALDHLDQACRLAPDVADYFSHRGLVWYHLGCFGESLDDYARSLALRPDDPETLGNLARLHVAMHRPDLARPLLEKALLHDPDNAALLGDLGVCHVALKRLAEGIACYRAALERDFADADIHYNLSRALLMSGAYEEGWRENEWRWKSRHYRGVEKNFPAPEWNGEPLAGKSILLLQEQGFGDAIQMIRYAPLLARRGGCVRVLCEPLLERLFAAMPSVVEVGVPGSSLSRSDWCLPMLSLPLRFDTRLATIPRDIPYLKAPEGLTIPGWRLGRGRDPVVGLIWRGKSRGQLNACDFAPIFSIGGIRFFSLQKGLHPGELDGTPVMDTEASLTDFAATARIMTDLDLIVSIETASAHLAGAMGKPVWILIPHASEWRWLDSGTTAPWYPSATLYRQTQPDSWADIIFRLAGDLEQWRRTFVDASSVHG